MSIVIESAETEALLAELAAQTRRDPPDLLLDLLRRERLADEQTREDAAAIASGRLLHERVNASSLIDPRPIEEILTYDANGLPI